MVKRVGAGLAVIQVGRRNPFGVTIFELAGGPALFGQWVVAAAPKRETVDVGGTALGVARDVVDFGEVAGDVAVREGTSTVLGVRAASYFARFLTAGARKSTPGTCRSPY